MNISLHKKLFSNFIFICLCIGFTFPLHAQNQNARIANPVDISVLLSPPYSPFIAELYAPGSNKLRATLTFRDITEPSWDVKLSIRIEGSNGVEIKTKPNFTPLNRINLTPNVPVSISGDEWAEYFNANNLLFTGVDAKLFSEKGILPEGQYTFYVEALDYNTSKILSTEGRSLAIGNFVLGGIPQVIMPKQNFVTPLAPQNIMFQWIMTAPPLYPATTAYKLFLYELQNDGVAPEVALKNGNVVKIFESNELKSMTFMYDAAAPSLELGKKYVYYVKVFDNQDTARAIFRNDGLSEPGWFTFGYPTGGHVPLKTPVSNYQFKPSDRQVFQWELIDNKAISTQPVSYKLKVVKMKSKEQDSVEAIKFNEPVYEETTRSNTSNSGWTTIVKESFEKNQWFAWQVQAFSGEQMVAESEISTFKGAPLLESFRAGDHDVVIKSTENTDITNLTGTGVVKLDARGTVTAEIDFKNIKLKKIGNLYFLEEGSLYKDIKDGSPINLPAKIKEFKDASFIPTGVKLDKEALWLKGSFSIPLDVVLDGESPNAVIKDKWVNYNSFYIRGGFSLSGSFELLEPMNFQLNLDTNTTMVIGATGYQVFYYGSIGLPKGSKNLKGERINIPFKNFEKLKYFELDAEAMALNFDAYRPVAGIGQVIFPSKVVVDFSDNQSPGSFDKDWKGAYIQEYKLQYYPKMDLVNNSIVYADEYSKEMNLLVEYDDKNWFTALGLQFKHEEEFKSDFKATFNTFLCSPKHFITVIENGVITKGEYKATIKLPLFDENKNYEVISEINDAGFLPGQLVENLVNNVITFSEDNPKAKATFTIKKITFKEGTHLNLTVDLKIPYIEVEVPNMPEFRYYGDYQVGFGKKNGVHPFEKQVIAKYPGLMKLIMKEIGAAYAGGKYLYYTSALIDLGDDINDATGKPLKVDMFGTKDVPEDLGVKMDYSSPPVINIPVNVTEAKPKEVPLIDSITMKLECGVAIMIGKVGIKENDPEWGTCFNGKINGTIYAPSEIKVGSTIIIGKSPQDFNYWFFDAFMYDQGRGVPLVPGIVNIVGLEGRIYHYMSTKISADGKKAEIKIDKSVKYGAGLYAQLIDAASNGQTIKADIGIELKILEGDFQMAMKGQATILNLEGRSASSAVTNKASAAGKKEVLKSVENQVNKQEFKVGDWTFKADIKAEEERGGLTAQNGTTKMGFGANVRSKSAYFNYEDTDWKVGVAGNKTPASFAFDFKKKTGSDAFGLGVSYLPGDSMGLNFSTPKFGLGGAYYDTKKKVSFKMYYDDFKIGVAGSTQEKQFSLYLQPNKDIKIYTDVDIPKNSGTFGLAFPGSDLRLKYKDGGANIKYNDFFEVGFDKTSKKGVLAMKMDKNEFSMEGAPTGGFMKYVGNDYEIGASVNIPNKAGSMLFAGNGKKYAFNINTSKKTGLIDIEDNGYKFKLGTGEEQGSGLIDFSWGSSKRFAINANVVKKNGSFLFQDGSNIFNAALSADSALINTSINGVSLYASGHKAGRGGISYAGAGTEVKLFGDKEGKGNILVKTNGVLFNVAADKTTGSGLVRYKFNNDTLYLMADRSKGIADISTKFGDNIFQLGYNAEGRGKLKVQTTDNTIALEGDKAGSGNILFSRSGFLIDVGANIPNKEGKLRLQINSDSIGAYFSAANGGKVNAAFGNNSFAGSADPSGKGNLSIKVGATILSGEADPNGLNSVFFKDGDIYLSTGLNKPKQYGYFSFKKAADSIKADIDKLNKRYSFATAFSGNAFAGYYNDGKTGGLSINTSGVKIGVMADKAGVGSFDFNYENNKAHFYGDKSAGNAEVSVVVGGKDSLTTKVVEGKKFSGALAFGDFAMSYNYAAAEDKFYKYENGNTLLHGYSKLNGLNGGIFKDGTNKVFIEAQESGKGIIGVKIDKDSLLLGVNDGGKNYINASLGNNKLNGLYIKDGDKNIKFTNPNFSLEAAQTSAEKMVDMKIGTDKRIRLSSTKYAYLNVNSHEFKMDATKPNQAYFYIDGREIDYKATDNQDSVSLGYKGDGANFLVAAHRAGRGYLNFDKGDNKLGLFADKAGAGRISVQSGTTLFDISGNKGTGNGSLRLKLGSDSLNIFADRASGIARLGSKFGDNSMYANYNAEGYGNISLRAAGNYIALGGDASGSGNITFENDKVLAAASADVKKSAGTLRFKLDNDSINSYFDGTAGNAGLTASFGGNAFDGVADKSGKGEVNFNTSDVKLNAALDPQGLNKVYFNKGELTFAAQNNKTTNYSNIRFKLSNDSVSAFADKGKKIYGFATSVSGTSLSARMENGTNADMAFATGETKLSLRASKAGSGAISYSDNSNAFYLDGDRTTGNAKFRLRPGSDSLSGSITDGKIVAGNFAISGNVMGFNYGQGQNNFFNFQTGDNKLNAFLNTDNSKGASFENKDVKVRLYNQGTKGLAALRMGNDSVNAIVNDNGTYTFSSAYSGNSLITTYNKSADKNIKLTSSAFNLTAGVFGTEKMVDFSFDSNKRIKISSTKFAQLIANNHEFKMDARGEGNPKFFIDGSEIAYEFNKDSVNLGWSGDDKLFNVMAHRLGRGKVRFKLGDNDVSLFANKEIGSAGVSLKVAQNFFQLEGNKTTGSGLMNIAIGADSVNVMADRAAGIASISTNVSGNTLKARYDATGKGFLNFAQGTDNKIELSGDASGSGSIYLQKGSNLIAANADINTQIGGFRFKSGNDSVNTSYNGSLGEAFLSTSISGASFSGKANKAGKGFLDLNASGVKLKAGADDNSNSIYFSKDNFLLAASNNKQANSGKFRLKFGNDSLNAFVDANANSAGFTTLVGDVALSGEILESIKGKLGVKIGSTQLFAAAEKQGSGTFTYADANNRFRIFGDKTTGEGALSLRVGSDSLNATAAPNKYTGALSIGELSMSYNHAPGSNSFYKFSTSGVSLSGFMKPDNSKGVRFVSGGNKVVLENAGEKGLVSFRKDNDSLNITVNDGGKHSFIGSLDNNYIEAAYSKSGDKNIKFNTSGYGLAAAYGPSEKAIDLTFDKKRINVSSKKFVLLQANSHEFKMDATNEKANPKFFIDGSEVKYEVGDKDSVRLGWEGGNDAFSVFAHRAGRGGLRFKKGDNDVSFFADKQGAGRISVATGSNAFMISGNKNTGYGAMRFKVGSDSINVLSDDVTGIRRISTAYSGNSLFAGFENGVGTVSLDAANTKINLKGSGAGNGSILFKTNDILASANADANLKTGAMRFVMGNDSVASSFNGSEGAAYLAAAYNGSAFRGSADKTGKGDVRLTANGLTLVGQSDPAGLNAISFKNNDFLFAASNDNKQQINSFRLRNGNDSLNAFVDKQKDISSVSTSVSGVSLGARLENGNNGVLSIATSDVKMDFASEKANTAKLLVVNGDNRVRAFGDKSTGDMSIGLQFGNDSLTASALSGKYKGGFALGGKLMNFAAVSAEDHNFNYQEGTTKLSTFATPNVGKGLTFATGDQFFTLQSLAGNKGIFKLRSGADSLYSFINDGGKHTFAASYSGVAFNTEYKKDGDKFIKLQGPEYLVEATEKATDKNINLKYKNHNVKVDNKRKASYNSGAHEFVMDAVNPEIPKLFIDGKEFSFDASQLKNKDSISFGLNLGNYNVFASAHQAGRGQFRFKSSADELAIWGNKSGYNRIFLNTSGTLIDLGGNPQTGEGALRFKLNNDSINLSGNPNASKYAINSVYGNNSFAGSYDGSKGFVSLKTGDNLVAINGDASGSGSIKLKQDKLKINASADINAKNASFAFANGNDSLSTAFDGNVGKANIEAAFGGNSFAADGNKTGVANLSLNASGLSLGAGLNPEGNNFINYKQADFAYKAFINKADGLYNFSFHNKEDSLAATFDKQDGIASLKSYINKNGIGAFVNAVGRVNFTLDNPDFFFDLMALKKGAGTVRFSGANGSGNFFGDVNGGFFNLKSRWGKDSMFVIGANDRPFTGGFAAANSAVAFQLNGERGHYFTFANNDATLDIIKGTSEKDASLVYKNGNTNIRLVSTAQDQAQFAIRMGDDSVSAKLNESAGTHSFKASIQKNNLSASFAKDGDKKLIFNGSGYVIENVYAVNSLKYAKFTRNGVGIKVSSDKKILVTTGAHEILMQVAGSNEPELYIDGVKQKLVPDVKFTIDGIDFMPKFNMDITMFKIDLPNFPTIDVGFTGVGLPSFKFTLPNLPNVNLAFLHLPNGFSFDFDGRLFSFDVNMFKLNLPSFNYDLDYSLPSLNFGFKLPAVDFKWRGFGDFDIDFTNNLRFELTKEYAKALYFDKYLMLDKNLLAKLSYDANKYVTYQINASAPKTLGRIAMKFDDLNGEFEKDKVLALNYQNAGVKIEPSAASLVYDDKSINYDATAKLLTFKNGATDFITLEPKKVATSWLGYKASLGADSLGFAKDDAELSVSPSAVKIAKGGKSLRANKTSLNLFVDNNSYINAGFDKVDAKYADASIQYAQGQPLTLTYLNNIFAVNKAGLKVAKDDKSLGFVFADKALSMKVASDSFMVSPDKFTGVYKNYKLGFSKSAGMNFEDGTRKVAISTEKVAASQDDMKLAYDVTANQIQIQKGDNYILTGAPGKVGVIIDNTKINFSANEGIKMLELEIPGFNKISTGLDAQNLAFLNFNPQIKEIAGGFSVTHDDKVIAYGTEGLKVNIGKDLFLNYTSDNKFNAAFTDFKANFNSPNDISASYKDASVSVTPSLKKLVYGDKFISLNDKNELNLFISTTRNIELGLAGTANVLFDDVKFNFEKNKSLEVDYKKDYSFKLDERGISTSYDGNSLTYEVGKALTLKQGKDNQVTITAASLETKWAGYNFSVGKDSLGFNKDGSAVSVSEKGARVSVSGKTLVYNSQEKELKFNYDANKFVEASPSAFNAKWDDAAIAYGKNAPLSVSYKTNNFTLNNAGLRLTDGARSIAYNFNQSASYRQGTDSFIVSKQTVFAKYQNYNFTFDKTNGLNYNDGSRSALINGEKIAINIDDISMAYNSAKTEVSFRKGSDNELTASPDGASMMMEGIKIAYFNDNGAKKLEFDVPQFAKINGGFDPKGGNFLSFTKDNVNVAFTEKDGGYEIASGDKSLFASPKELRFNYSASYKFNIAENNFAMTMGDMKAYYAGITNMGMEYQQAKFDVTAERAKLAVGDKYLAIDKDNNLRLQLQDTRYITANPLAMNVVFDDVTASVEKDKQVSLKYKEDNLLRLTDKGLDIAAGNRSLNFVVGESIAVKDGQNTLQIGKKGLSTNWSGYLFTLNEDSLSFTKENASVKASPTGARVAYDGKSLKYEQGKALELYYDDHKFLKASAEAIDAQWDDASMVYGKDKPLKLVYQQNSFTLAKTALQLANGDNVLTYKFDQTISFRMKGDSFVVNKESVLAKYSNYNFALSKSKGLTYSDGSRSAEVSGSKIAIQVEDVSMYYDATKTEVGFKKGSDNELTASPEGASLSMEGVKIAYFRDNGAHKLEFDVPKFAKIYGGYDAKGGNFFRFNKDNIDFAITEKDGGYEFVTGDKLVAYTPNSISARYGKSAYLNLKGTDFDMQYNDLKANYSSPSKMGMSYGDAAFVVAGDEAKLGYQNYLITANIPSKTLRAQISDARYLEVAAAGKVDFKYDDILASFEKDKQLAVNYKNEHKLNVTSSGAELISGSNSLVYDAGKSITVKSGTSNQVTITPERLTTTWSGYNFSVGKDSLGFDAEGAKVAVTATAALASYGGKSLVYESGKSLKFFYDDKKFVEASPIKANAQWDDVTMSYAKNESLKVAYQTNVFTLNKSALSLTDGGGRVLKYQFNKTISVKVDADSFMVNESSLLAKYQKYNLSFSKTNGLSYNDGSRSLNANSSKIALTVDDVSMYYDATKTEIGFKRGTEQEVIASPTKSSIKMEGVNIAYFRNNGSHELEFDVPSFAKVSAGYDPKGQSMFSFAKDNVAFSVMEKNGGVEFKTMDKIAYLSPTEFNFYYSNDMFMKFLDKDFSMQIKDFKGYFKAKDNFGMIYNDAKFIVEPTFARLAYQDKYISLDDKKNLRVQYEASKYLIASPTKLNFIYDDVAFNFEKDKELAMNYKEDYKLLVNTSGVEASYLDKSLGVDFAQKTLLIKDGKTNSIATSEKGIAVDWATYKFMVSADSLGFAKDGASVSAARSGLRVAYNEKSLSFATATKTFQVNYEANKYVTLSPEMLGAKWDDMGVDFSKNASLSMYYKDKKFAINKDYIALSEADARLAYKFAGELSVRYKNDSLNVSKEKISGKFDKYSMSVSKTDGAMVSDGTQIYKLKDKAEITYQGYTLAYDLTSKAIGFNKGTEWGFYGSPISLGFNVDQIKVDLNKETGVSYVDGNNTFKLNDDLLIQAKQLSGLTIGVKGIKNVEKNYYMKYATYEVSYGSEDGFKFADDKNWFAVGGAKKYFATHWNDLDVDIAQGKLAASKAGYGLIYGGDLYAGIIAANSEITLSKDLKLGLLDKINKKGVQIGSDGIVTLINGDQKIIAGGSQPIRFEGADGVGSKGEGSANEMTFAVAGMDIVVKPADGNNITLQTKVQGIDINLETSGEGTMKAIVSKDGTKYGTIYKNFYSWGVALGNSDADTDGPKVEEVVKMDGPANIGYITQNSTSVLQVVLYAAYSSKTQTFVLNGQATGSQPLLCTKNVTLAAKFSPNDWYVKIADRPREKWASIKPLCLFVETSGYFYVDANVIEAGVNYGYHFDINTGWVTIIPEVFEAKVGAYFDFDIGGEGKIQMRPKFAIPYIRVWVSARAGIYGCVDIFGGGGGCTELIGVRIAGELALVITDEEKSASGKVSAGVTIVGKSFDAEFSAKVNF